MISCILGNIAHIGHFHRAGVPARKDLDENQELYYPAMMRAIAETGYDGYVGQEFSPRNGENWLASLQQTYDVCNV